MSDIDAYKVQSAATLAATFNPAATAHLGVDLQNGYCKPAYPVRHMSSPELQSYYHRTQALLGDVALLAQNFADAGIRNFWVRHTATFNLRDFADEKYVIRAYGLNRQKIQDFVDNATNICAELSGIDAPVLDKPRFSLFEKTGHAEHFRASGLCDLLLSGGQRNVCVRRTVLNALQEGFRAVILDDLLYADALDRGAQRQQFYQKMMDEGVLIVDSSAVRALLPKP